MKREVTRYEVDLVVRTEDVSDEASSEVRSHIEVNFAHRCGHECHLCVHVIFEK